MAASEYTNPNKAKDLLFDMFLAYVKSPDFGNLSEAQRIEAANCVDEMKNSMNEIKTT
jgi:hypothetical protein